MERVAKIETIFYNSGGWESGSLSRIAYGGGADSII
jgi:hypothetical protein